MNIIRIRIRVKITIRCNTGLDCLCQSDGATKTPSLLQRALLQLPGRLADNRADRPVLRGHQARGLRRGEEDLHADLQRTCI